MKRSYRPIRLRRPKRKHVVAFAVTAPVAAVAAIVAFDHWQDYVPVVLDALTPWR